MTYFRNAIQVDGGAAVNDNFYGQYVVSDGTSNLQNSISRSSTFSISATRNRYEWETAGGSSRRSHCRV